MDLVYYIAFDGPPWPTIEMKQREAQYTKHGATTHTILSEYASPSAGPTSRAFSKYGNHVARVLKIRLFEETYDDSGFPYWYIVIAASLFPHPEIQRMFIVHDFMGSLIRRTWISIRSGRHMAHNPSRVCVKVVDQCVSSSCSILLVVIKPLSL